MVKIPDFNVERISLKLINNYKNNAKKHPKEQIDVIKKSIQEFGFRNPILLNNFNKKEIVAGHGRLIAAKELEMSELPCISAEDLTENQIKAFRIMDNKSQESEWDFDLLQQDFKELENNDYDLDLTGFGYDEISEIIKSDNKEPEEDDFDTENSLKEPKYKINVGEIWKLGEHRLMCGDSTDKETVDKLMNGDKADMCFHSPPYNMGSNIGYKTESKYINSNDNIKDYDKFLINSTKNAIRTSKESFINLQFLANNKHDIINFIAKLNNNFKDIFFWKKTTVAPAIAENVANSQVEVILLFGEDNNRKFGNKKFRGNFSNYLEIESNSKNKNSDVHNAGYSIQLPTLFIEQGYQEQSKILDLFGGTGTTLMACEQLNRKCYMMELDPIYCSIIIERWEKYTQRKAELIEVKQD